MGATYVYGMIMVIAFLMVASFVFGDSRERCLRSNNSYDTCAVAFR